MKILLLTSWFLVLLLLYLRFQSKWNIRRSMREAEKKKESDTDNYSSDDDDILGKTRTEFPSRGMRGNAKEPDQNRKEKGDSFAVGKSSDPPEKEGVRAAENEDGEFYPSLPENETDEMLEEQEALSLLLDREIERQFDLSEHTIKITSSCKSYSFVILRLHNDREEGAASKSLGFRCR